MALTTSLGVAWVCEDCYLTHAGYDEDELGRKPEREPLSLIGDDVEVTAGLVCDEHPDPSEAHDEHSEGCETRDFSWSSCDGCGSHLGGTRHALTMWAES